MGRVTQQRNQAISNTEWDHGQPSGIEDLLRRRDKLNDIQEIQSNPSHARKSSSFPICAQSALGSRGGTKNSTSQLIS